MPWWHITEAEVQLQSFLTWAPKGDNFTSRSLDTSYPLTRRVRAALIRSAKVWMREYLSPARGFERQTVKSAASRHTAYTIPD
jgi:hypothetical protein